MRKQSLAFLEKYLNTAAPSSFEVEGQKVWMKYIKPYVDEIFTDSYGTAVGVINPKSDYKVVIEAHADEISWYVNYIDDKGYIYVICNGSSDHQCAPSMRLNIHGDKGVVDGLFGWPAIHVRRGVKEAVPTLNNIHVDVGAESKQDVLDLGIKVGTVITYKDGFMTLNNNKYIVSRALDNRIGGFIIAEVARTLKEKKIKLPYGLYIVNAVQEETTLGGAQMIAHRIKPDCAIVIDVHHDTQSPMYNKKKHGDFTAGKGPIVDIAPSIHMQVRDKILTAAEENKIPYQLCASSGSTGTDTDAFAYANGGVPSALISLPIKYMHTTVETAHSGDIQHCIDLYVATLKTLQKGDDFSYFKKV